MSSENDISIWQFLWAILSVPIMAAWRKVSKNSEEISQLKIKQAEHAVMISNIERRFDVVDKKLDAVDEKLDKLLTRRRVDTDHEEH